MNKSSSSIPIAFLMLGAIALFSAVLIRTAWICDDAYITLRTVDNLVNGYGLTWNVHERVQAFTHPLWMSLLSAVYFFTREAYYTTIVTSVVMSLAAALVLMLGVARSRWTGFLAVLGLVLAKCVVDFSTSGLENPLTHLLLLTFIAIYVRAAGSCRTLALLSLIAALGTLNRPDTLLLYVPALAAVWWRLPKKRAAAAILLGFLPLIVWEFFSILYYGFPASNTAYAKLNTGIGGLLLAKQGIVYMINSLQWQTYTPVIILLGMVAGVIGRKRCLLPPAVGILLYLAYVVSVGGDFMTGRFLAAPFVVSLAMLAQFETSPDSLNRLAAAILILAVGLFSPGCPMFSGADYGLGEEGKLWQKGIGDERAAYFQSTGLLVQDGKSPTPDHEWVLEGLELRHADDTVVLRAGVGMVGYFAGPEVTIVDRHALSDAFLARLPTWQPYHWRVGHYNRQCPDGYLESLREDSNLIRDDSLREYYDHFKVVISGSLFDWRRFGEILKFNFGWYDHLVDAYWSQPTLVVEYREVTSVLPDGTPWNSRRCFQLPPGGMRVNFSQTQHDRVLEISTDANDEYEVRFLRDTVCLLCRSIPVRQSDLVGLKTDYLPIDSMVAAEGFDKIDIVGGGPGNVWAVGHLVLFTPRQNDLIATLIDRCVGPDENFLTEPELPAYGYLYDATVALRRARVTEKADSLVFYMAFEALRAISTKYRVFFHVVETADGDRFHNFDFRLNSATTSWSPGQPVLARRAIPRLEGPLSYRIGFFNGDGRLGKPYQSELDP